MRKLLMLDEKNYDTNLPEILRVAVRGIILFNEKLLLVENDFGEVKLPGGGKDEGESDIETLIREVKEETGYEVIPKSIEKFGEIEEKRLSIQEPMVWHQISRLYFCEVERVQGECSYTENEKMYGFRQVFYTMDEAIQKNEKMFQHEGEHAWNQREYRTFLLIKEYLSSKCEKN